MINVPKFKKWLARCLAPALLATTAFAQTQGPNGHYYQVVLEPNLLWAEARDRAAQSTFNGVHGHLATITSAEEDAFIESLRQEAAPSGYGSLWVGGWQSQVSPAPTEGWHWINGEGPIPMRASESGYANWQAGEPNDYNGQREDYLSIGHFNNIGWNDEPNTRHIHGYVVEYPSGGMGATVSVRVIDPIAIETAQPPVDTATFQFSRDGDLSLDLPVFYSIHGTAMNGGDYDEISRSIIIPAGQSSVNLAIVPRPDPLTVVEPLETVGIRLEPSLILTPSAAYRINLPEREAAAVIYEGAVSQNTAIEIGVPRNGSTYKSGEVVNILAVVSSPEPVASVDFYAGEIKIGSATRSAFTNNISFFEFAWNGPAVGSHYIQGRTVFEDTIISSTSVRIIIEATPETPVVSVRYVDQPIAAIAPTSDYALGYFEVTRIGPGTQNLQVFYDIGGTATANVDYEGLQGYVVIGAGRTNARVNVVAIDDLIDEPTETVVLSLIPVGPNADPIAPSNYIINTNYGRATLPILDNDSPSNSLPVVSIYSSPREIEEPPPITGPSVANIRLTRFGDLSTQLTVDLQYSGSATVDVDFTNAMRNITFPAGSSNVSFNIPAVADGRFEGTEHAIITIAPYDPAIPGRSPYAVHAQQGSTGLTILDGEDGPPVVSIWPVRSITREPRPNEDVAPASFVVRRTGATNETVTVFLSYSGSATPGADYITPSNSVTFAPGQVERYLEFYAHDDSLVEGSETVVVSISPPTTQPVQHYIIDPEHPSVTLTIADNDQTLGTLVSVETADPIATEPPIGMPNSDPARFIIWRRSTNNLLNELRVFFSLHGTGKNGIDYQTLPTSVVIPAGQELVAVQVVPISDGGGTNGSRHFEIVSANGITWEGARTQAEQSTYQGVSGHLATITSAEEDHQIDSLRQGFGGGVFWVGGYQEPGETSITEGWKWVNNEGPIPGFNGSESAYANWLAGEPNDYWGVASENYMVIGWLNSFGWNDQGPSGVAGYVVEYDLTSPAAAEPMETVALRLESSPLAGPQPDYSIDAEKRIAAAVIFDGQPPAGGALEVAYPSAGAILDGNQAAIELVAVAYHPTQNLQNVAFWVNDRHIGSSESTPDPIGGVKSYKLNWTDFLPGTYLLYANGEFANHDSLVSSPIPFQIRRDSSENQPPTVAITAPTDGTVVLEGERVGVRAEAADSDGTVVNVSLLVDGNLVYSTNAPPLNFFVHNLSAGAHSLQARATDNLGLSSTSAVVNILVRHPDAISFVQRQLPASYAPGVPFVVQLRADPRAGTHAYAVEDRPPQGWQVSVVSHDGYFDSVTGKVKFGPFTDGESRILTYRVIPPNNALGRHQFTGNSSANGAAYPITGDEFVELMQQYHPADRNQNFSIALDEATAYAAAWKAGDTWPVGPNPIPISYVTSAGTIWKRGEAYRFEGARPAPFCWVPLSDPVAVAASAKGETANRVIPGPLRPGLPTTVQISASPSTTASCYAIEEKPPRDWLVSNISHGGVFDEASGTIRWGAFVDATARTVSYNVTPPADVTTYGEFVGRLSVDGKLAQVGYASSVVVESAVPIAITNFERSAPGVTLAISGPPGQAVVIESSSDFQNWNTLTSVFIPETSIEFTDTTPQTGHRFYRLRVQ